MIELLQPAASSILDVDARAVADLAARKGMFSGLDHQPAASAMAGERRAKVATEMRAKIAPGLGWVIIEDNLECGAYEWLADDVVIRLSKTNRVSRLVSVAALLGVQAPLFPTVAEAAGPRDEVLIRLMGDPLTGASVDVASVRHDGGLSTAIPLKAIAAAQIDQVPNTGVPAKTTVALPGTRRPAETG
jgi:hypothetical protein